MKKSYTASLAFRGFIGGIWKDIAASSSHYLTTAEYASYSDYFTVNTTWQTPVNDVDVDNGGGDVAYAAFTIEDVTQLYKLKLTLTIDGNLDAAGSTSIVKIYDSSDTLLETRTHTYGTINATSEIRYMTPSTLANASYITVEGNLKEASGDYDATLVVDFMDAEEDTSSDIGGCTFTVGAEAANVINVAIQLLNTAGSALTGRGVVEVYLSDDANGDSVASSAEGWAIGTDGTILKSDASNHSSLIISEVDGDIDIDITESTGADTYFLVVVLPGGRKVISDAIVFAA